MTSVQVVETSVTNNSPFQHYIVPDDHTRRTTDLCIDLTLMDVHYNMMITCTMYQARRQDFEWGGAFECQSWGRMSGEGASY